MEDRTEVHTRINHSWPLSAACFTLWRVINLDLKLINSKLPWASGRIQGVIRLLCPCEFYSHVVTPSHLLTWHVMKFLMVYLMLYTWQAIYRDAGCKTGNVDSNVQRACVYMSIGSKRQNSQLKCTRSLPAFSAANNTFIIKIPKITINDQNIKK